MKKGKYYVSFLVDCGEQELDTLHFSLYEKSSGMEINPNGCNHTTFSIGDLADARRDFDNDDDYFIDGYLLPFFLESIGNTLDLEKSDIDLNECSLEYS